MKYLITGLIAFVAQNAFAQMNCFPTCSNVDGRMISVAGSSLSTLDEGAEFKISVPDGEANLILSVFDGDTLSSTQSGTWDFASQSGSSIPLDFTLFADPLGDGSGLAIVWTATGLDMVDNAWKPFVIANVAAAQAAPGTDYVYRLMVELPDMSKQTWSAFKVGANMPAMLSVPAQKPFAFSTNMFSMAEIDALYPAWPTLTPTPYDGSFSFAFDVPPGEDELIIWDGDFDRGKGNGTELDTDDFDTNNAGIPPWASPTHVRSEGVATVQPGDGCTTEQSATACPADDRTFAPFARSPSIEYRLIAPDGAVFTNDNPSGNLEWEQFKILTGPSCNTVPGLGGGVNADYCVSSIQAGTWVLEIDGLDISNLNGLRLDYDLRGVPNCP